MLVNMRDDSALKYFDKKVDGALSSMIVVTGSQHFKQVVYILFYLTSDHLFQFLPHLQPGIGYFIYFSI